MTKEEFVLKYFGELPERTWRDVIYELEPETVCNGSDTGMINLRENIEAIDQMQRSFLAFWRSYDQLDPTLRYYTEKPSERVMIALYVQLMGRRPVLRDSIYEDDDFNDLSHKDGFFERLRHNATSKFNPVHHHAISAEHPSKRALYDYAAFCWSCFRETKIPNKPSPGTLYYEYLSDFIQLMGKDWSVESVVRTSQKQLNDINK